MTKAVRSICLTLLTASKAVLLAIVAFSLAWLAVFFAAYFNNFTALWLGLGFLIGYCLVRWFF